MSKRPTIQDVADRAGVSRSAISKVLRNAYGISDEMRSRVEAAIAELNYRPQFAARGLRGRTFTFGVTLPDMRNQFFADIMDGVWVATKPTSYQSLLAIRPSQDLTDKNQIETMLDRKLDGLLLVAPRIEMRQLIKLAETVPMVVIGRHEPDGGFDTANNDDEQGTRLALEHLIAAGHRKIAHVTFQVLEDAAVNPVAYRLKGYLDVMREHGLASHIHVVEQKFSATDEEQSRQIHHLLTAKNRPTAIFAWSDKAAIPIMSVAADCGLRIPEDFALIGYDNWPMCAIPQISLTSVDQDPHRLGMRAAELLIERIEGRTTPVHFVTEPRLVVRSSSLSPAAS